MTRKDYELIAGAFRTAREYIDKDAPAHYDYRAMTHGLSIGIDFMSDVLALDNPRFDPDRFLAACIER